MNTPTHDRLPAQAGGPQTHTPEPLLRALCSALEDILRPVRADLGLIRSMLASRTKPHYTVEEVAEMTGRSPYTVRRWIAEERIRAIRIAGTGPKGRLLVPREELDALIEAGLGSQIPEAVGE